MAELELIDSHCHIDFDGFDADRPAVLARAREAGIVTMICIGSGSDIAAARSSVALAAMETDVFATVGIHPHDVSKMTEDDWRQLETLAIAPRRGPFSSRSEAAPLYSCSRRARVLASPIPLRPFMVMPSPGPVSAISSVSIPASSRAEIRSVPGPGVLAMPCRTA